MTAKVMINRLTVISTQLPARLQQRVCMKVKRGTK